MKSGKSRPVIAHVFLLLASVVGGSVDSRADPASRMELLTLHSKIFHNTRTLRVWLPVGYRASKSTQRYPVFYFTDGIATFHGRHLDQISDQLVKSEKMPPWIFVGIDNGGSTQESKNPIWDRANEYLPYADEGFDPPMSSPQGKRFPEFLEQEVRPLVESTYRTLKDPAHVGLGGASFGALIALFTVLERPGAYGWLLLESPSLYVGNRVLIRQSSLVDKLPKKIYVGVGTREGKGDSQGEMVSDAREFVATLKNRDTQTCLVVAPGAEHEERAWRERLPGALGFLLGGEECPK